MMESGQIQNAELEEEINREMDRYFNPKFQANDEASVSSEYARSQKDESELFEDPQK